MLVPALPFFSGCSSAAQLGEEDPDAITEEELREGLSWGNDDGSEPDDVADPPLDSVDEQGNDPGVSEQAVTSCKNMAGYVRGVRRNVCVTVIDGKYVEINTANKFLALRAAARRAGVTIRVVSGFRTMAKQRELYRLYKQGRGNLAAPPGYSNHQSGLALDLNTSSPGVYSFLANHGAKYGFRRTVPSERWHWERR